MDLSALVDFNVVATHGGFGRASRVTGRPKTSLSRRVMQLEAELGVRLLQRGARTLTLTEEGRTLHANTARLLSELEEAADTVSTHSLRPTGRLRVSAPTLLAYETFGSLGATFVATYPEVRLEVVAEDRFVDCIQEDYDVVIRANPAPDTRLAGRCFLRDRQVIVASPSFAMRFRGPADVPVPVPAVTLLAAPDNDLWHVSGPFGKRVLQPQVVARFSSISMVFDAVIAGAGAAVLPVKRVRPALTDGRLESYSFLKERIVEVWALYAPQRQLNPRIKAFVTLLVNHFADDAMP